MKIGIYGKAGSGKTTFVNLIRNPLYKIVNCDIKVEQAYKTNKNIIDFVKEKYPKCVLKDRVNKNELVKVLIKDKKFRLELQEKLYQYVFKQIIDDHNNIIMDGIVPEYAKHFDMVLKASCDEIWRTERLSCRGMPEERIKQIDQLQKGW